MTDDTAVPPPAAAPPVAAPLPAAHETPSEEHTGAPARAASGWRALLPGAAVCAVGFEVLKLVGTIYVPRLVASSSALYGSLGIVIAILAWLAFFGRLLVYGAVVNVLRWEGGHGTVQVPVEVPRVDNALAVGADRSGAVVDTLPE